MRPLKSCCAYLPLFASLLALSSTAQTASRPEPRLRGAIVNAQRSLLPGSSSPRLDGAQDLGPVPSSLAVRGITLVFNRSPQQQQELQQLLAAQQDPASPEFHHWLTPSTVAERFGVAESDLMATEHWLTTQGFTIDSVANARDRITFSGSARQVAAAFSTSMHRYMVDGDRHLAPNSALSLPSALAAITTHVLHLSDFRPSPMARVAPRPDYTISSTQGHYLVPLDLGVMYDMPVADNSFTPGNGQSVAIVGQSFVDLSPSSIVRSFVGGTTTLSLTPVLVPGTGSQAISPGDAFESDIDLEYTGGLLSLANLYLVYVGSNPAYSVFDALAFAIDQNLAPVISVSYGECETFLSQGDLASFTALLEQAALQGQTIIAASGDSGSSACTRYNVNGSFSATQQQALAIDFPAASPLVTAIGGTEMAPGTFSPGNSTFWRTAVAPFDTSQSLLSYVPEITWNEDSSDGIFAGGGGASALFPRPAWQIGIPGISAGVTRLVPDIALQSSSDNPGFLFCSDDPEFSPQSSPATCNVGSSTLTSYPVGGGTSFAAPTFAAMVARLNQATQSLGQGNLNQSLYRLAASSNAASIFHDITAGTIACTPGTPLCSAAGASGFPATVGYDQATGLGSLDYLQLQQAWPVQPAASSQATVTAVNGFSPAIQPGDTDVLSISVGTAYRPQPMTTPTGSVAVSVDGTLVQPHLALVPDPLFHYTRASFSFVGPSTPGSHIISVTYPGDSTHGPSSSTAAILVGNVAATGSIAITAGNLTVPANGSASTSVQVTPAGGYDGRLLWSLSLSGGDGTLTGCYFIQSLPVQGVSSTTLTLATGTACSSSRSAARARLQPLSVTRAANDSHPAPWLSSPVIADLVLASLLPLLLRRRRLPSLLLVFLSLGIVHLSGCGGSGTGSTPATTGSSGTSTPPTPAMTYTVTLTGRDSVNTAISSYTTFTLIAQ